MIAWSLLTPWRPGDVVGVSHWSYYIMVNLKLKDAIDKEFPKFSLSQ